MPRPAPFLALVVAGVFTAAVAPAAAQPSGGCQAFGQNVAGLAAGLGGDFGAAASGAARLEPGGIVTFVVEPEQAALCPS
jgi:hypothetical protein